MTWTKPTSTNEAFRTLSFDPERIYEWLGEWVVETADRWSTKKVSEFERYSDYADFKVSGDTYCEIDEFLQSWLSEEGGKVVNDKRILGELIDPLVEKANRTTPDSIRGWKYDKKGNVSFDLGARWHAFDEHVTEGVGEVAYDRTPLKDTTTRHVLSRLVDMCEVYGYKKPSQTKIDLDPNNGVGSSTKIEDKIRRMLEADERKWLRENPEED